jgi:hypothetical protein
MSAEQDLINKLMISKKIMERHDTMGRNGINNPQAFNSPMVEEYQPVNASYNLPQEFLSEAPVSTPKMNTEIPTADRIANSKLPDEIKRLMMEHPIQQPNAPGSGSVLSQDLVEKASRLMNTDASGKQLGTPKQVVRENVQTTNSLSADQIRNIVKETVEGVLKENGLLVESTKKSNEIFKFRVGQHIFEGKLLKVRKVSE